MKTFTGKVVSDKMTKAAVVLIERKHRHPIYGKVLRTKKKIHTANEIGAKAGDLVRITEVRPVSKTIKFKISEIVSEKRKEKRK